MMLRGLLTIALGVLVLAPGAEAAPRRERPMVVGCTQEASPFCTMISTRRGTYALYGGGVPANTGVAVYGSPLLISGCGGTGIAVTSWSRVRLHCRARR
jgi:hypothetical protein